MVVGAAMIAAAKGIAQSPGGQRRPLLQVEIGDSLGLPLPDATMEVYAFAAGGTFREWLAITPNELTEGVYLLRLSSPGYRPAVLSVPLRGSNLVALRGRLGAERDTTRHSRTVTADDVRSIGIVTEGRAHTDLTTGRRILDRETIERAASVSIAALLRDVKGFDVVIRPAPDGGYEAGAVASRGGYGCELPVFVNGDRRLVIPFSEANQRYGIDVVEAIELVPRAAARLYGRLQDHWECGVLVLWVKQG
jgi:hypothetical protein